MVKTRRSKSDDDSSTQDDDDEQSWADSTNDPEEGEDLVDTTSDEEASQTATTTGRLSWRLDPEDSYSDWTIEVSDEQNTCTVYHVHKAVLSVPSKYFAQACFNERFGVSKNAVSRLDLPDAAARVFGLFLDVLYESRLTAQVKRSFNKHIVELYYLADFLDVPLLRHKIQKDLQQDISLDKAHAFYKTARSFYPPIEFFVRRVEEVVVDKILSLTEERLLNFDFEPESFVNIVKSDRHDVCKRFDRSGPPSRYDDEGFPEDEAEDDSEEEEEDGSDEESQDDSESEQEEEPGEENDDEEAEESDEESEESQGKVKNYNLYPGYHFYRETDEKRSVHLSKLIVAYAEQKELDEATIEVLTRQEYIPFVDFTVVRDFARLTTAVATVDEDRATNIMERCMAVATENSSRVNLELDDENNLIEMFQHGLCPKEKVVKVLATIASRTKRKLEANIAELQEKVDKMECELKRLRRAPPKRARNH